MTEQEIAKKINNGVDYFTFCNMIESLPESADFSYILFEILFNADTPHRTEFALMLVKHLEIDYERVGSFTTIFNLILRIFLRINGIGEDYFRLGENEIDVKNNIREVLKIAVTKVDKEIIDKAIEINARNFDVAISSIEYMLNKEIGYN